MVHRFYLIVAVAFTVLMVSQVAHAQSGGDPYSIMRAEPGRPAEMPEPWLPPVYQSPRGTTEHIVTPQPIEVPELQSTTPPPLYAPRTGRMLQNLPTISGAGPDGLETSQDRATRCVNQAGVNGLAAGDRNSYIGSCINQ
jgi:hypothetical protein